MELTVRSVASQYQRSERFVQQALDSGALPGHRRYGRTVTVDDLAAKAWSRSLASGRRWTQPVRDAALDLLSAGRTLALSASERSRLRRRLRDMQAAQIAHASGGVGSWARYRAHPSDDMTRCGP